MVCLTPVASIPFRQYLWASAWIPPMPSTTARIMSIPSGSTEWLLLGLYCEDILQNAQFASANTATTLINSFFLSFLTFAWGVIQIHPESLHLPKSIIANKQFVCLRHSCRSLLLSCKHLLRLQWDGALLSGGLFLNDAIDKMGYSRPEQSRGPLAVWMECFHDVNNDASSCFPDYFFAA